MAYSDLSLDISLQTNQLQASLYTILYKCWESDKTPQRIITLLNDLSERIKDHNWDSRDPSETVTIPYTGTNVYNDIQILVTHLTLLNAQGNITYAAVKLELDKELPHIARSMIKLDCDASFWINLASTLRDY